jgi:hypothetical protein
MTLILLVVAWLLTYLLHSTALLGGAWLLERLRVVRSNAARDTLWKVALVGGLITATAQLALRVEPYTGHVALAAEQDSPFIAVAGVPGGAAGVAETLLAPRAASVEGQALSAHASEGRAADSSEPSWTISGIHVSWPALALNLWLLGAMALGARLVWLRAGLRRRLGVRRPVEGGPMVATLQQLCAVAGLRRPVRLTTCPDLCGPIAFGDSEICVPERVAGLEPAGQRAVLAHELGHLVRRDPAWLLAAATIESLLFVQPLNRLARRRVQEVAEYLCDDWAAGRTDAVALARCLAEVASWMKPALQLAPVSGMAENGSHLVTRVQRLLDGGASVRGASAAVRLGAAALAVALVAWAAPGVAAEDLGEVPSEQGNPKLDGSAWKLALAGPVDGDGWASVREGGRLIVLHAGYSAHLSGRGRIGFREWGRALAVPEGYRLVVDGEEVTDDRAVCEDQTVRLVDADGRTAWTIRPMAVPNAGKYAAELEHDRAIAEAMGELSATAREAARARAHAEASAEAHAEATADAHADDWDVDVEVDGIEIEAKVNGALDTLIRAWARDPEAVREAARRIARTYERELRPQFESLGIEVGRELAPALERLTARLGRDLAPEFARLGSELGRTIVDALADPGIVIDDGGAGAGDYRTKKRVRSR